VHRAPERGRVDRPARGRTGCGHGVQ
jgi:hypothetical protein